MSRKRLVADFFGVLENAHVIHYPLSSDLPRIDSQPADIGQVTTSGLPSELENQLFPAVANSSQSLLCRIFVSRWSRYTLCSMVPRT